ncbi:hypothetical protein FAZ78_04390 [Cereibacter changlensis]|uniref:histidine kinase n=1 Tax=Cereibacter changlensis TaxID=402884 RepID=A0A4U0Z0P8_9RHOB|nr:hypothetical protein FAZ78_04390 [Cereibacter changlensis]
MKNTLATVMSFAGLARRHAVADTYRFSESFLGRIRALVRSHDLLLQGNLRCADWRA